MMIGFCRACGDFHLAAEDRLLDVARGVVVEVVEADLAAGEDFGLLQQRVEFRVSGVVGKTGFVRMDAGAGPDSSGCQADRRIRG